MDIWDINKNYTFEKKVRVIDNKLEFYDIIRILCRVTKLTILSFVVEIAL